VRYLQFMPRCAIGVEDLALLSLGRYRITRCASPLTRSQRADLARLKNRPDSEIDVPDIPPHTEEQLTTAFQPNRQLIAVRLDREVLAWLRSFGAGYSTRINNILRVVMENAVSASSQRRRSRRP